MSSSQDMALVAQSGSEILRNGQPVNNLPRELVADSYLEVESFHSKTVQEVHLSDPEL